MNKEEKEFDAVKMMRTIRDKISKETQNMTYEEFKEYIDMKLRRSKNQQSSKRSEMKR